MKTRTLVLAGMGAIGACSVYSLVMYPRMPERVPIHWGIDGQADGWSSRLSACIETPLIMAGMLALLLILPALSPKAKPIEGFRDTYNMVVFGIVAFMSFVHVAILQAAVSPIDVTKWIMLGVFSLFMVIGNVLGKTRRNYWMGIRTPWTLESDLVWFHTHRVGGRMMVGAGVLGIVIVLLSLPYWLGFIAIGVSAIVPIVYSYMLYKALDAKGALR